MSDQYLITKLAMLEEDDLLTESDKEAYERLKKNIEFRRFERTLRKFVFENRTMKEEEKIDVKFIDTFNRMLIHYKKQNNLN